MEVRAYTSLQHVGSRVENRSRLAVTTQLVVARCAFRARLSGLPGFPTMTAIPSVRGATPLQGMCLWTKTRFSQDRGIFRERHWFFFKMRNLGFANPKNVSEQQPINTEFRTIIFAPLVNSDVRE